MVAVGYPATGRIGMHRHCTGSERAMGLSVHHPPGLRVAASNPVVCSTKGLSDDVPCWSFKRPHGDEDPSKGAVLRLYDPDTTPGSTASSLHPRGGTPRDPDHRDHDSLPEAVPG